MKNWRNKKLDRLAKREKLRKSKSKIQTEEDSLVSEFVKAELEWKQACENGLNEDIF